MNKLIRDDIEMFQGYFTSPNILQLSEKSGIALNQLIKANTGENPLHELDIPKKLT